MIIEGLSARVYSVSTVGLLSTDKRDFSIGTMATPYNDQSDPLIEEKEHDDETFGDQVSGSKVGVLHSLCLVSF